MNKLGDALKLLERYVDFAAMAALVVGADAKLILTADLH